MPSIRAPASKKTTTLTVAVRCRPLNEVERRRCRNIIQVTDEKGVTVLDPDLAKDYLDRIQNRTKEKSYTFDYAFGPECTNEDVYRRSIASTIAGIVQGLNATVFAYGSTGSGKTHTMVGTRKDHGLMVLSLHMIFDLIKKAESSNVFEVTCSYLEVYNEVIYDLLEKSSGHLELREDPVQGIVVAGLRSIKVQSADRILELLNLGNSRRKTESTEANATSSRGILNHTLKREENEVGISLLNHTDQSNRMEKLYSIHETGAAAPFQVDFGNISFSSSSFSSHAVLEITVKRKQRGQYHSEVLRGKLALVDLAGSERASETNSGGQKLRDGANINRSLLALANCINALGKQQKKGLAYVPYRNSKLTRILKDGLSGNSQTIMVATISPADDQYHHTINTLKYADRAKEIKTHVQKNIGTLDNHVADYQKMIENLQVEISRLRSELAQKDSQLSVKVPDKTADDELSWLNILSRETSENVQEHINLKKALFELEETNLRNRIELQHLDAAIAKQQVEPGSALQSKPFLKKQLLVGEKDDAVVQTLRSKRQVILDNIRDNDEAGTNYKKEIEVNETNRCQLQEMIDKAIKSNGNRTYLRILSQYRLLGMANTELQFELAIRDQVIHNQREAQRSLWNMILGSGLDHKQITDLAAKQGITIEDWAKTHDLIGGLKLSPNTTSAKFSPFKPCGRNHGPSISSSACIFQHWQDFSSRAFFNGQLDGSTLCREEHHSSYYLLSQSHSSSPCLGARMRNEHWARGKPLPCYYPETRTTWSCHPTSFHDDFYHQKDHWHLNGGSQCIREELRPTGMNQPLFANSSKLYSNVPDSHGLFCNNLPSCPDMSTLHSPYSAMRPTMFNAHSPEYKGHPSNFV